METKICKICNKDKNLSDYSIMKMRNGNPFVVHQCKSCLGERSAVKYREKLVRTKVQDLASEIWMSIEGFEDSYMISDKGRVKSLARFVKAINDHSLRQINERIIKQWKNVENEYMYVTMQVNNKRTNQTVHVLMATAFMPNPNNKPEVNHLNGIRWDNRLDNFQWATTSENAIHKIEVLGYKHPSGEKSKLSKGVYIIHPDGHEEYVKGTGEAGRRLGASGGQMVSKVINGIRKNYKGYRFRYADEKAA